MCDESCCADCALVKLSEPEGFKVNGWKTDGPSVNYLSCAPAPVPAQANGPDVVSIHDVIERGLVTSVFQPIVELDSVGGTVHRRAGVVGVEALARGPVGTSLHRPDALFAQARRHGVQTALDWECRAAAGRAALDAGLAGRGCLFVNVEATSFRSGTPEHLEPLLDRVSRELHVVVEITERALTQDPEALLHQVRRLRSYGFGIALDDVGADPASLALLPFIEPDVVKLDLSLVQNYGTAEVAAIAGAVRADAERRGAVVLAEGIETEAHVQQALILGATLGQGWHFGGPGDIDLDAFAPRPLWDRLPRHVAPPPSPASPWDLVAGSEQARTSTKRLLLSMSNHLESHPHNASQPPVVLAAFQHADHFSPGTARRFAALAERCSFVGALGVGLDSSPVPGVRGGRIDVGHPLAGEWTVVVIGPHYAAALIAKDLGDTGPDADQRFQYVITHDRELVTSAARCLVELIEPDASQ